MAELIVYFLEAVQVERDKTQRLCVTLGAIEFFFESLAEQAAIVQSRKGVSNSIALQSFQIFAFDEERKLKEIGGREHVDHCGEQKDGGPGHYSERLAALKNFIPQLNRTFFGKLQVRERAKKSTEELATCRNVQRLQRLDENFEKSSSNGRARLKRRAGAGRV